MINGIDTNTIFIILSCLLSGLYAVYCFRRIKPNFKDCTTYKKPDGSELDYTILRDCALITLLIGGSFYLFFHAIYFGIFDEWLLSEESHLKSIIMIMGAIYYIFNVVQGAINYVNNEISKKLVRNKSDDKEEEKTTTSNNR